MSEDEGKKVAEEAEEELEEGELSSEDEEAPQADPVPAQKIAPAVPEARAREEPQDDLETFMRKKAEQMQARAFPSVPQRSIGRPASRSPPSFPGPPGHPSGHSPPQRPGSSEGREAKDVDYRYLARRASRSPPQPSTSQDFGDTDYRHPQPQPLFDRRRKYEEREEDGQAMEDAKRARRGSPSALLPPPPMAPALPNPPQPPQPLMAAGPPPRGGLRGRMNRFGRPSVCKFFRDGFCREGPGCTYSHAAVDSCRKAELCKFYQQGFCKKSLVCPFLHGEWPCKAFQKAECSKGDDCQFSHEKLDDFTQPIYDQMLRDEELAANIRIPTTATKRKTLLPVPLQPPKPEPKTPAHTSRFDRTEHPNAAAKPQPPSLLAGPIAPPVPPSVPDPTGGALLAQAIAAQGYALPHVSPVVSMAQSAPPRPPFGLPPPGLIVPPPVQTQAPGASLLPTPPGGLLPTPVANSANVPNSIGALPQAAPEPAVSAAPVDSPAFNVNAMLAKIKASMPLDGPSEAAVPSIDESPASPTGDGDAGLALPPRLTLSKPVQYRLVLCHVACGPNEVSPALLAASQLDSKLKNDPRIAKAFGSSVFGVKPSRTAQPTASTSPNGSSQPAPSRDPRESSSRDPRARDPRKKVLDAAAARPSPPVAAKSGPTEEELVAMQLQMTAALAAGGGMAGNPFLPPVSLATSVPSLTPFTPPSTESQAPTANGDQGLATGAGGWMPSLSSSAAAAAVLEGEAELAEGLGLGAGLRKDLPFGVSSESPRYAALPAGVKVRKLTS